MNDRLRLVRAVHERQVQRVGAIGRVWPANVRHLPCTRDRGARDDIGEVGDTGAGTAVVAGHAHTDEYAGAHADRLRVGRGIGAGILRGRLNGPGCAVRRVGSGDLIAFSLQLHPERQRDLADITMSGEWGAARCRPVLEGPPKIRRHDHEPVCRTWIEALTDHHAGLGPIRRIADAVDLGRDRAVAAELLVHESEVIGRVPDIPTGRADNEMTIGRRIELARIAPEPQAQIGGAVGRPVLRRWPGPIDLGVVRTIDVVVLHGHGLCAAVDNGGSP